MGTAICPSFPRILTKYSRTWSNYDVIELSVKMRFDQTRCQCIVTNAVRLWLRVGICAYDPRRSDTGIRANAPLDSHLEDIKIVRRNSECVHLRVFSYSDLCLESVAKECTSVNKTFGKKCRRFTVTTLGRVSLCRSQR